MTRTWDCPEARIALGVYVLGAIDPQERSSVEAHLATCAACQAELAELAGLPALLAMVPADEAIELAEGLPGDILLGNDLDLGPLPAITLPLGREQHGVEQGLEQHGLEQHGLEQHGLEQHGLEQRSLAPPGPERPVEAPPEVLATIHDLSAARRRRQRLARAGVVAAAAVVIGAASFGGTKLAAAPAPSQVSTGDQHSNGQPNGPWQTAKGGSGQVAATVAYRSMGWGMQMDALVTGIPMNTRCQMWVVETNGSRIQVGGWDTDAAEGTVWYPASAPVSASDVKAFVITVAGGQDITVTRA